MEVLGPSLWQIFGKYFPNENVDDLVKEYREHNKKIFASVNSPMPNAETVLKTLKQEGYHVGVVSTKMHETVLDNLKLYHLDVYVDDIVGKEDVKLDKPNPEGINLILKKNRWYRDELIYVGDSVGDIKAGQNAGAYTVAYYFNPRKKAGLDEAKANIYISDLAEILPILNVDHHFTYNLK